MIVFTIVNILILVVVAIFLIYLIFYQREININKQTYNSYTGLHERIHDTISIINDELSDGKEVIEVELVQDLMIMAIDGRSIPQYFITDWQANNERHKNRVK